jgi:hypothetical protein
MYPTRVRNLSLLLAISARNPCSIWRVVAKGCSKASCHDFKAVRSKTSLFMAVEAQGRQDVAGQKTQEINRRESIVLRPKSCWGCLAKKFANT